MLLFYAYVIACVCMATGADAHGYLSDPPARNGIQATGDGGYGLGFGSDSGPNACGDPFGKDPDSNYIALEKAPGAVYTSGQEVKFEVTVRANHGGYFEFRLCNGKLTHECFESTVLRRTDYDGEHNERWYIFETNKSEEPDVYTMSYKLPDDFVCDACVLQWYWKPQIQCLDTCEEALCGTYSEGIIPPGMKNIVPCPRIRNTPCGEDHERNFQTFINCADISIVPASDTSDTSEGEPLELDSKTKRGYCE